MKVFLCVKPNGGKMGWRIMENLFCRIISCLLFLKLVKKQTNKKKHEIKTPWKKIYIK